ncbi:MAG: hypothetical protein ACRD1X_08020, partial [Vicinamibacteria bacterium]
GELRRGERGSALVVVLLMLLLLLPLTLILSRLVMQWQRQAADFYAMTGLEYAARAGFEDAVSRLGTEKIQLRPNESTTFEVEGIGGHTAHVRVSRQADSVVSLDGRVLEGIEAALADLDQMTVDPDLRRVHLFRKLEVCRVDVTVARPPSKASMAGVRLGAVMVRVTGGAWRRAGLRIDRGFF